MSHSTHKKAHDKRKPRSDSELLDLDLETAPDAAARSLGFRAYVGGVLYVEGGVVLLMGAVLLASYWPPFDMNGEAANPVGVLGMWLAGLAVAYMIVIGFSIFVFNLLRPSSISSSPEPHESGEVARARRYASMKRRTRYIFDDTIECERDADEAIRARDLY